MVDGDFAEQPDGDDVENEIEVDGDEANVDGDVVQNVDGDGKEGIEEKPLRCRSDQDCDDGIECTFDTCNLCVGTCSHLAADIFCKSDDPCKFGICILDEGCIFEQKEEGEMCYDGDPCTNFEKCTADGECVGGEVGMIGSLESCTSCDMECEEQVICRGDGYTWAIYYTGECSDGYHPEGHVCEIEVIYSDDEDEFFSELYQQECSD